MSEPNKIFRSAYQEDHLYGDTSSSRHVKYTMNGIQKRTKLRCVLKLLLCIVGFILIAISFTLVGLSLYPDVVGDCKRQISTEKLESENQQNDQYMSTLGKILRGVGICKELSNRSMLESLKLNKNKIESPFNKENQTYLEGAALSPTDCACLNSSKEMNTLENGIKRGNETPDIELLNTCICNASDEIIKTNKMINEYKNYDDDLQNSTEKEDFNKNNETDAVNEKNYMQSTVCNFTSLCNINNDTNDGTICSNCLNGSKSESVGGHFEVNTTYDKPIVLTKNVLNFDTNDTKSAISQEIFKCQCFKAKKGESVILNGSEIYSEHYDGILSKDNECICPETSEKDPFNSTNTKNGGKNNVTNYPNVEVGSNNVNSQLNATAFINVNETRSVSEKSDVHTLTSEKCECPEMENIEGGFQINKFGLRNQYGDCVCSEARKANHFNTSKTNRTLEYDEESLNYTDAIHSTDFYFNESESSEKSPKTLGTDNFHMHEVESINDKTGDDFFKTVECTCPKAPSLLKNNSSIAIEKHGFKTADGDCVCPETLDFDDIHAYETTSVKLAADNENKTTNFNDFPNSYEDGTVTEVEESIDHDTSFNDKEVTKDNLEIVKENESTDGAEKELIKFKDFPNIYENETILEKESISVH